MKKMICTALALLSFLSFSAHASSVSESDLRDILRNCRGDLDEARCLRRGIRSLIGEAEDNALICRGNGSKFALYNQETGSFVDSYYSKTPEECQKAIRNAKDGYVCSSNGDKAAIRNVTTLEFIDKYYSKSLNECMTTINHIRRNVVCVANNGKYARYNIEKKEFLDTQYGMTLDECIQLIPR